MFATAVLALLVSFDSSLEDSWFILLGGGSSLVIADVEAAFLFFLVLVASSFFSILIGVVGRLLALVVELGRLAMAFSVLRVAVLDIGVAEAAARCRFRVDGNWPESGVDSVISDVPPLSIGSDLGWDDAFIGVLA